MNTMENKIKTLLMKLGIDPSVLGFRYLVSAIGVCYEDPNALYSGVTKILYPKVARQFNTTPSRVERAMRHSIERMHYINPNSWENLVFPPPTSTGKYTNSQFIGACVEYIKMNEEE